MFYIVRYENFVSQSIENAERRCRSRKFALVDYFINHRDLHVYLVNKDRRIIYNPYRCDSAYVEFPQGPDCSLSFRTNSNASEALAALHDRQVELNNDHEVRQFLARSGLMPYDARDYFAPCALQDTSGREPIAALFVAQFDA